VAHLLEELPYPSDLSICGQLSINIHGSPCRCSFRLLPLFLPLHSCHFTRARTLER